MDFDFSEKNVTCCSLELSWKNKSKENNYSYEIIQKEEKGGIYERIYYGKKTSFEVNNLKSDRYYIFKLNIIKDEQKIYSESIKILTLKSPKAILSEKSFKIAIGENVKDEHILISESQMNIINNCSKLVFDENNEGIVVGNFDGIEIKLTYEIDNHINLYYISFDIAPDYYKQFFTDYIEKWENNVITQCYFLIQKLPTIFIYNLLEKGPVIFTGKRMGGTIASSLAFYIMLIGKTKNIIYGNSFLKKEKNCIGVVTFGSPSFLTNLAAGFDMKDCIPFFCNIKDEFDYFPVIIDFINKKQKNFLELIDLFQKMELLEEDKKKLIIYLNKNNFTDENLMKTINKFMKIPFGYYFMMKSDNSLVWKNEYNFDDFYYFKPFSSSYQTSNLMIYKKLSKKSSIKFYKDDFLLLENKSNQLEFIKIIRRIEKKESEEDNNKENKDNKNKEKCNKKINIIKGIVKFKLSKLGNKEMSSDIINKINLLGFNNNYMVNKKDIYYDNDEITAYIDNLEENINHVVIANNFGGFIIVKNIINIQGSGSTRDMLITNIEKLFLIPFFKLIEIFYASLNNKEKFDELKKHNFGNNFEDLRILKPFEKQIEAINELLFLSRPDILGRYEKECIEFIKNNLESELTNVQKYYLFDKFKIFYMHALQLQIKQKINCLDSENGSIAKKVSFPHFFSDKKEIKKLFMCENKYFEKEFFISEIFDDSYIKNFMIEQLIKETLQSVEELIKKDLKNKNDEQTRKYLNEKIGNLYNNLLIPNICFILILIISSIESGDEIKFNHDIDVEKIASIILYPFIWIKSYGENRAKYEKDFKKNYSGNELEKLRMRNIYYKTKIKEIVDSNIFYTNKENENYSDPDIQQNNESFENKKPKQNKAFNFSCLSENKIFGKEYYEKFLKLINNKANDFQGDIEISIYQNLQEGNQNRKKNLLAIKQMMNDLIDEEESKKGFLALLRQSYLLGKLRSNIVSINLFFIFII